MELDELRKKIMSGVLGLCIGDALGVPVEGAKRSRLQMAPVKNFREFGSHNQPAGTWSDDASMTLCLMDTLKDGYSTENIAEKFNAWWKEGLWTAHGHAFDIGRTVSRALKNQRGGTAAVESGVKGEFGNGNGALMRILPMAFYTLNHLPEERHKLVREVSSITHAHARGVLACIYYVEMSIALIKGESIADACAQAAKVTGSMQAPEYRSEFEHFQRLFHPGKLSEVPEKEIKSDGYVMSTLEAAVWCLMNNASYSEAVLAAVNLGGDTDTTAAVCGGPAGIAYGLEGIPVKWKQDLLRGKDILRLCDDFARAIV